jgi:hypothetical protein
MHFLTLLIIVLYVIQAKANEYQSETLWNLFKDVHKKQYASVKEQKYR